jgi:hypothetical protein
MAMPEPIGWEDIGVIPSIYGPQTDEFTLAFTGSTLDRDDHHHRRISCGLNPVTAPVRKGAVARAGRVSRTDIDPGHGQSEPKAQDLFALLHQVELAEEGKPIGAGLVGIRYHGVGDRVLRSINGRVPGRYKSEPLITFRWVDRSLDLCANPIAVCAVADKGCRADRSLRKQVAECR